MVCEHFPWQPSEISVAVHVNTAGMPAAVDLIFRNSTITGLHSSSSFWPTKKAPSAEPLGFLEILINADPAFK